MEVEQAKKAGTGAEAPQRIGAFERRLIAGNRYTTTSFMVPPAFSKWDSQGMHVEADKQKGVLKLALALGKQ